MKDFLTNEENISYKRVIKILNLRKNDSLLIILSTNSKKLSNEIIKNLLQEENTKSFIYNTDDIIKELIYKNQFDSCNIINLYDGQNIDNIIKNLQFKRDFIVEKLLKIIIVIDEKNLEKLKENAFDFFSTNSFSYSFHDHSFKTSLDEVNRKTLDERINEYKSYTVALNINQNPRVIISLLSSIADEAAKISLYEEASEYLQKALKKAKEEKFSYEEASIKSNLGVCYQNLGDINKALKYCEEAKKISKQIGDIEGVASSLGNIGVIYKIKGDLDKALNYHEESQKISKQIDNLEGIANSLNNIGNIYQIKGNLDKALNYYEESQKIFKQIGNIEGVASSLGNIGVIYEIKGDLNKALNYHEEAKKTFNQIGNLQGISSSLGNIGVIYETKGDLDKALNYYEESQKISKQIGNLEGIASSLNNIGNIYETKGDLDKALNYYEKSQKIYKQIGNLQNIGNIYQIKGDLDKALNHYEEAQKIFKQIGNLQGVANSLGNMGSIYQIKGDLDKALKFYEEAQKINKQIGNLQGVANSLNNIGNIYRAKDILNKALNYYEESQKIYKKVGVLSGLANSLGNMGNTYKEKNEPQKAIRYLNEAAIIATINKHDEIENSDIVFMFIGRLNTDKGIFDLVQSFKRILQKYDNVKLFLIGPDEENIENQICEFLKSKNVIRIDYVSNPQEILNVADVLVLPSYREGFGTIVIEAASMGIPCIASDIYGLNDAIVNNKTGLLHKVKDVDDMIEKYEYLIENKNKIKEYGVNAKNRVYNNFKDEQLSNELKKYIDKFLKK